MTNTVLLVGNLGADPELRSTNGGTDIASFNLGTSRVKRDSEGKTFKDESGFTAKDTEWHRVTCFNGLGRVVSQHAAKGMLVSVKGRIHNSKWTDKEGVDRYGYEIIADDVQFLSRPRAGGSANDAGEREAERPVLEGCDALLERGAGRVAAAGVLVAPTEPTDAVLLVGAGREDRRDHGACRRVGLVACVDRPRLEAELGDLRLYLSRRAAGLFLVHPGRLSACKC